MAKAIAKINFANILDDFKIDIVDGDFYVSALPFFVVNKCLSGF